MPYNSNNGAPARSNRTPRSDAGSFKPGSKSAKHRGHRAGDATSAGAADHKKARWNPDERAARGHQAERPRGGESRGAAPRGAAPRGAGAGRATDGRPNWEPREKGSAWNRNERPARGSDRGNDRYDRDARPARGDDRPARSYDRDARTERPARSFDRDSRPARSYDRTDRTDRDARTERPAREDRSSTTGGQRREWTPRPARDGDRPARSYDRDARTERPARSNDDRPARSYDRDSRPARDSGARDSGERREWTPRPARDGDRPARSYDRDARTERPARSYDDRPARGYDRAARPQTRSWDRDSAPRGGAYGGNASTYSDSATKRAPQDDVVLERLESQAVEAGEVDGISFSDLGLGDNIVRVLTELGAASPFPIQAATIPDVLAGKDVLGRGRTGSGKTIAFGAPLVERLLQLQKDQAGSRREFGRAPRALILAPTRELALQIDRTVQPIARSVGLFTTQIYGGVPYARQLGALQRGVDIIVGTPGRVGDLAAQGKLDLSGVIITVLDEADHMCELGFAEPVQEILDRTSNGGQKLLFSATLDRGVAEIVEKYLVDPAVFEVAGEDQASSTIDHQVLLMDQRDKQQVLIELASGPGKKLVFARTRAFAEMLADVLDEAGIRAESIHGDLNQSRRTRALEKLTSGRVDVLVATDVAARGIHVDDITLVIQADAPDEYKSYLHRSGRTGRAGKEGTVVTLVPRNRRRRTEELLQRADITAEWTSVVPGDIRIAELAGN